MKFYITTPIYYVNAKPHIGHAYTTLAADVLARWKKLNEYDVFFLTGTDEHGSKVAAAADVAGKSPQEFVNDVSVLFKKSWENLNILNSDFIRTTEERHKKSVAVFLEKLKNNNALYEGEYKGLYCTGCENFITEKELEGGLCSIHKTKPEEVAEKNWFFKLSDYIKKVGNLIESDKIKIQPQSAKKEALGLFKQGLDDFSVSREKVKWGIKLPWDESQTIYVWVEALLNYVTAIGYPNINDNWPADLQLIGKDILKFHAIYWPAMLLAANLELPKELFVNGYFTIDGQKMSKSLGNVIDPNDLVAQFGVDSGRYLLLSQFPFGQDGDIKAEKFKEQYNSDLANGLGNLVSRVINVVDKNSDTIVLTRNGQLPVSTEDGENLDEYLDSLWQEIEKNYNNKSLDEVLKSTWRLIAESDKIVEQEKIWELPKKDAKKAGEVFYVLLENIRQLGWLIRPFLPETSDKIFKILGITNESQKSLQEAKEWGGLPESIKVQKADPLFPRK